MDLQAQEGLLSTWREGWRTRNVVATFLAFALVAFYVVLYFGGSTHFGVAIPDVFQPLAERLHLKSKWLLYGALYSVAMIGGAAYYLRHTATAATPGAHRHERRDPGRSRVLAPSRARRDGKPDVN
jgi:hypothetical protein